MTVESSHVGHVNDLQAQAPVLMRRGVLRAVRTAKFVARKQWVVCGADDMYVRVFNYNTMDKVKQFEAHTDYIRCAARRGSNVLCPGLLHHTRCFIAYKYLEPCKGVAEQKAGHVLREVTHHHAQKQCDSKTFAVRLRTLPTRGPARLTQQYV